MFASEIKYISLKSFVCYLPRVISPGFQIAYPMWPLHQVNFRRGDRLLHGLFKLYPDQTTPGPPRMGFNTPSWEHRGNVFLVKFPAFQSRPGSGTRTRYKKLQSGRGNTPMYMYVATLYLETKFSTLNRFLHVTIY